MSISEFVLVKKDLLSNISNRYNSTNIQGTLFDIVCSLLILIKYVIEQLSWTHLLICWFLMVIYSWSCSSNICNHSICLWLWMHTIPEGANDIKHISHFLYKDNNARLKANPCYYLDIVTVQQNSTYTTRSTKYDS